MKILFISLGCDKNLVDTEEMLGYLNDASYTFTDNEEEADIIIINTCCFIHDAKEESIGTILEMAEYKKIGKLKVLIVAGCLAQRYQQEVIDEIPEVDVLLGTSSYDEIAKIVDHAVRGMKENLFMDLNRTPKMTKSRLVTTGGHYAHLKIAEGCDRRCTYCIIPSIRGQYRSIPMEDLVLRAKELAEKGVKELILVAQETTLYGIDLYGKKMLPELLRKLCEIEGFKFIRLLYCYPEEITDELIEVIKSESKICNYLDMPIQHASDGILRKMGRRISGAELTDIIRKLRQEIPDIVLRTTLMSGFPTETEADHALLLDFVNEMEFDRLGVFTYSAEEGTPASIMSDQIDDEAKVQRRNEIMELQQEIALDKAENMIGRQLSVMIEGKIIGENAYKETAFRENVFLGRTYMDAPDIDGNIFIATDVELISGDFVEVTVTGASGYDLMGEIKV